MPKPHARFTQAEMARAIRAAKAEGWQRVRIILPSGGAIELAQGQDKRDQPLEPVEPRRKVML